MVANKAKLESPLPKKSSVSNMQRQSDVEQVAYFAYFLSQDNDCHYYLVPADKREAWNAWRELDGVDERSWMVPEYAIRVNGSPAQIEFLLTDAQLKELCGARQ